MPLHLKSYYIYVNGYHISFKSGSRCIIPHIKQIILFHFNKNLTNQLTIYNLENNYWGANQSQIIPLKMINKKAFYDQFFIVINFQLKVYFFQLPERIFSHYQIYKYIAKYCFDTQLNEKFKNLIKLHSVSNSWSYIKFKTFGFKELNWFYFMDCHYKPKSTELCNFLDIYTFNIFII